MAYRVRATHPLARGLRSLWVPGIGAPDAGIQNLAQTSDVGPTTSLPFPAGSARPTYDVGQPGIGLALDGAQQYAARSSPVPWLPVQEGGNATMAVYAEAFSYPTDAFDGRELYSVQGDAGLFADRVVFCIGYRPSDGVLRGCATVNGTGYWTNYNGDAAGNFARILAPPVRTPFLCIFTSRGQFDHDIALHVPGQNIAFSADVGDRGIIASNNPTTETLGGETFSGAPGAFWPGRIYGAWFWNRGFSRDEMAAWLTDPFGVLEDDPRSTAVYAVTSTVATAPGAILPATLSLLPSPASATAQAGAAVLPVVASIRPGLALGSGDRLVAGQTVGVSTVLLAGAATNTAVAGAQQLGVSLGLVPGTATATSTRAGVTLAVAASLAPGGAFVALPRPYIGGGARGPGGDLSRASRRAIKRTLERAAAERAGEEYWPDPADLEPDELDEWAARAEAAGARVEAPDAMDPAAFMAGVQQMTEATLQQLEANRRKALVLLTVA